MPSGLLRPERAVALPEHRTSYYGGAWHEDAEAVLTDYFNPATGTKLGSVAWSTARQIDAAIAAAKDGFKIWRATRPMERARILRAAAQIIRKHGEELALIDSANCGNPIGEMVKDAEFSAAGLEFFAGLVTEMKGATIPMGPNVVNYTMREPLGVVVRINAYNHPFMFAAMRAGAPLAAGNSLIVKPPEQAPLSTLRLAELIGPLFPPGVFSVLPGGRECGEMLVRHPGIAKVALIGSVPAGKAVLRNAADTMKKITLELGGKNALIAYPDADPEKVADGTVRGMNFTWCGQSCGSTSRAFLHEKIYDATLAAIKARVEKIKPGIPTDPATEMGCLVSKAQYEKVLSYIEYGKQDGARLVSGGVRPDDPQLANGFFMKPTVFAEVTRQMRLAREEVFGPILSVFKWSDEDEMFATVNDVEYGLTASIWTRQLGAAHRAAERVEAGYVWVNGSSAHFLGAPFGGYKFSGMGRDESIEELLECTQLKNINVNLEM